jgi:hypothetical protein
MGPIERQSDTSILEGGRALRSASCWPIFTPGTCQEKRATAHSDHKCSPNATTQVALRPDSIKCVALLQRLRRINEQTQAATAAFDDGRWHVAMEQCSLALAWDVSGATAFTAHTLTRRAAAAAECSRLEDALRDLDRSAPHTSQPTLSSYGVNCRMSSSSQMPHPSVRAAGVPPNVITYHILVCSAILGAGGVLA